MSSRLRPLRWLMPLALVAALALAPTGGATHLSYFQIGHDNATGTGINGLSCFFDDPCLTVSNSDILGHAIVGNSSLGYGVMGSSGSSTGVYGTHTSGDFTAAGVLGSTASDDANAVGVQGSILLLNPGAGSKAVWGYNAGQGANGFGVYGEQQGSGVGVVGTAVSGVGVAGTTTNPSGIGIVGYQPNGYAGYFIGNLAVTGTLTKGAGAFRIDHPLAPARKYLQHSFVESPDMKNVYDGVVRTDRRGFATVRLPAYFSALNRSFRYQLTLLGKVAWGAQAVVWEKIRGNRFVIRSKPGVEVSWQVTGIRRDRYANAHRIKPEIAKPAKEQGTYLAPELYGKPQSQAAFRPPVR